MILLRRLCHLAVRFAAIMPASLPGAVEAFQAPADSIVPDRSATVATDTRGGLAPERVAVFDRQIGLLSGMRMILITRTVTVGVPSISSLPFLGAINVRPDFNLDKAIASICSKLKEIYDNPSWSLKSQVMLTVARQGMADALGIPEPQLVFFPHYKKIAEELVEDVLRSGNCRPEFSAWARQIELAYQRGQPWNWISPPGVSFAPAAPAAAYPSAQGPASPSGAAHGLRPVSLSSVSFTQSPAYPSAPAPAAPAKSLPLALGPP